MIGNEWLKLRAFNGDIKHGFEELVCQLARAEDIPGKESFTRVGAPDGGVESYCVLSNGEEYGWQAKFFKSMGNSQWSQLDKSFKTAFKKHPKLTKFYICIPLDRQDPRIEDERWFMDKWENKVEEWTEFAESKGREIEFEYWGSSELFDRLSRPENAGKLKYWFNKEEFSDIWFKNRLEEAIKNLDERYTPELNFDLPIVEVFNGLARDENFKNQFLNQLDDLLKKTNKATKNISEKKVSALVKQIQRSIEDFKYSCKQIDFSEILKIDQEGLAQALEDISELIDALIQELYRLDSESKEKKKNSETYNSQRNTYGWEIEKLRKLDRSIHTFLKFINGPNVSLSNNPFLSLVGRAGVGKSHLLADIAEKRLERDQYTILLLGQHFNLDEPWNQIQKLLQLNCNRDAFLGALNSKAQAMGSRILIFIDAINEGQGRKVWKDHFAGFISSIKRYPHLGAVFSLRTSYEEVLIPESLYENEKLIRITHHGFANHEYEASKYFFNNYEIKQPSIPLLHPEFSNPLFLKLFCEGLYNKGLHEIPDGYQGITSIIDFYLDSINIKISDKHNIPKSIGVVQKIVDKTVGAIAERNDNYLPIDDAFVLVTGAEELKAVSEKAQFFKDLISEGVLAKNLFWKEDSNYVEGIYIAYERFGDYLKASYLIDKHLEKENPSEAFRKGNPLYKLIEDENACFFNKGLIEAFSVYLSEITGYELYEIAPQARVYRAIASAFIESIIWRKKGTLQEKVKDYINDVIIKEHHLHDYFLETILLVTSIPDHFFNSEFLHKHLCRFSMPDRDAWWVPFIHYRYPGGSEDISAVTRLIDWAWTEEERDNISDNSVRLMGQALLWFLASTNRTLRDSATKALVCLLQDRIKVLIKLISTFSEVNDPYIRQRVYAIAYGCALRTDDLEGLKELGQHIFDIVFDADSVIPDLLLRDYAREIIEYSLHSGNKYDFSLNKIRPPFNSSMPKELPSDKEIKEFKIDYDADDFKRYQGSQNSILSSMKTNTKQQMYGDFGRYIFQYGFDHWKDVDVHGLSNLAVKWIFEKYGYDVEKHGEFDSRRKSHTYDRHYVQEERIGKKYQWIVFHELLARVSDNYNFYEDSWSRDPKPSKYEGPWNPYVRDIDPTIVIKQTQEEKSDNFWWVDVKYSNWSSQNEDWIYKTDQLPNPLDFITVVDPNGERWLNLEILPSWTEPPILGKDKWDHPHKHLWYQIRSYLIKKSEKETILEWAEDQNYWGRWMPEAPDMYQLFSREYYWSPSWRTFKRDYFDDNYWDDLTDQISGKHIGKAALTTLNYMWEEQYDGSKESTISFLKPSPILDDIFDLKYSNEEGKLLNKKGETVCFDPSIYHSSYSCLLIKKDYFLNTLEENGLDIFWTLLGGKEIRGGSNKPEDYIGRLEISGVAYYENDSLTHEMNFIDEKP